MGFTNLRQFIETLKRNNEIVEIDIEVDSHLELAEIHRRVAAADGPALFFKRVKNSSFPVVTNLFGSMKRVGMAFHDEPEKTIASLVNLATKEFPPSISSLWNQRSTLKRALKSGFKKTSFAPIQEVKMNAPDLEALPLLKTWPQDGGHFITLPLVYTESPTNQGAPNLGMYRIQRYDKTTTGLHFQIAKGGGFHYAEAEKLGRSLPVAIFIGGPPALILSAITPLPENVPELLLAAFLQGEKLKMATTPDHPYPLIGECEFALLGTAEPYKRRLEGPFGDHYGYYSLEHEFPIFNCKTLFHRKDAIYPATVVGKPRQEDFYIGVYLQKLLSPLFPIVMPAVKGIWSYGETGFHSLTAAIVKERFYRESMVSAFRILGEGQLSLSKFLLLTDQQVNLENFKEVLTTLLERFTPETDLFIFSNLSLDTLDYTGPTLNKGSRGVMLGIGEKKRELPQEFIANSLPTCCLKVSPYCPGCLVLEVPSFSSFQDFDVILQNSNFKDWPLLILVDDLKKALKNNDSFLWTTFTRFEPAADIHARNASIFRNHVVYKGPILIDARMKPTYPEEVIADEETHDLVTKKWNHYFPKGMEMGESLCGHVC